MKKCVLFLTGRYTARDLPLYRKLSRGCFKVAVDGGFRFFLLSGLTPDLLIGDFDSLGKVSRRLSDRTEVLVFPVDKDKTDCELALDYCLEHGARHVDIVQPSLGDPDHFLANLFLLTRVGTKSAARTPQLGLIGPTFEAFFVSDSRIRFSGAKGSTVSIIPVSGSIRLSCRGTAFDVESARIIRGQTRPTRNRLIAAESTFEIAGQAFVIRLFPRS